MPKMLQIRVNGQKVWQKLKQYSHKHDIILYLKRKTSARGVRLNSVSVYRAIIVRFRGKLPKEDHIGPTFEEFVRYVTESHGRMDEHWAPIYQFCTPCSLNFTVIAKVGGNPKTPVHLQKNSHMVKISYNGKMYLSLV